MAKTGYSFEALAKLAELAGSTATEAKQIAETDASETTSGRSRHATQTEVNDATAGLAVTPETLLAGLFSDPSDYGGLTLPECLGGVSFRWGFGQAIKSGDEPAKILFKTPFDNDLFGAIAVHNGTQSAETNISVSVNSSDQDGIFVYTDHTGGATVNVFYIAIGN